MFYSHCHNKLCLVTFLQVFYYIKNCAKLINNVDLLFLTFDLKLHKRNITIRLQPIRRLNMVFADLMVDDLF